MRFASLGATAMPIRPSPSLAPGNPLVKGFQVSPPSVDLYSPLPAILMEAPLRTSHAATRQARPRQSSAAATVNNVRIGRSPRQRADGAGRLVVENRIPRVPEIRGLPDAAVDGRHVENVRLVRHAGDRHSAASAERPDAAP